MRTPLRYAHVLIFLSCFATLALHAQSHVPPGDMSLNGTWEAGIDRHYSQKVTVPGLAQDTSKVSPGTLWYRRTVQLPGGDWQQATLTLNGARFAPAVYVNGEKISSSGGGMAPTVHLLRSPVVAPGRSIQLEIALQSQKDLDPRDASAVPGADLWRTNISSGLWDSASLHFFRGPYLARITPFTDFKGHTLSVHWQAEGSIQPNETAQVELDDEAGRTIAASALIKLNSLHASVNLPLPAGVEAWSPDHPTLYRLVVTLGSNGMVQDRRSVTWGLKDFHTQDKRFYLNGEPIQMRGGTIVWQRFLRTPEAAQVAFDPDWFQQNVFLRLKSYGANTMRFHLGLPPEALLDLCDRDGLMVQMEWPFFHGVKASIPSMVEQWTEWLDVAMRHPSVMIVHGWNETDGDELKAAWEAMNAAIAPYPKLVVAHRDTLHIHKYWWSLFENLGLYYDSYNQFDRTIMVDEFGGNYLNLNAGPGDYPAVKDTFLRFLGREQTPDLRLEFHAESNARVGEYWRRIGAAGILPFCILGGPQDGSSWFLGDLKNPRPMPVWDELAATFAPQSVSLDVWDRNYTPSQSFELPLFFFNDTSTPSTLSASVQVRSTGADAHTLRATTISADVPAHSQVRKLVRFNVPAQPGDWQFAAVLENKVPGVTHPIVSSWDFRTLSPVVPPALQHAVIGVPPGEPELIHFLEQNHLRTTGIDDPKASLLVTSAKIRQTLSPAMRATMQAAVERGQSVVLLDVGPHDLGAGYKQGELGDLQGAPTLKKGEAYLKTQDLFSGIKVTFAQLPEPESHLQPGVDDASLWANLPRSSTWIWNGLRGGLIAPAADMEVSGLSPEGFLTQWAGRGADIKAIPTASYYAYQLAGYYAFSTKPKDAPTIDGLRKRVKFLAEDAPSLKAVLDPNASIEETDLNGGYRAASAGKAQQLLRLASCGKGLTRTAVAELRFGPGKGNVILSQAITAGRLVRGAAEPGFYGIRYDPAAEQFVLNLMAKSLGGDAHP